MVKSQKSPSTTELLNVDLEIKSRHTLVPLVRALESHVIVLYHSRTGSYHLVTMELLDQRPRSADAIIRRFGKLLGSLPTAAARLAWERATSRVFDVGIQAGNTRTVHQEPISATTIAAVAKLGASVTVTTYGAQE